MHKYNYIQFIQIFRVPSRLSRSSQAKILLNKGIVDRQSVAKEDRKTAILISDHSSSIVHSLTILTNLNIPLDRPKGVSNLDLSIDRRVSVRLTYILKPNTLLIQCP